jgi:hypothetical protein
MTYDALGKGTDWQCARCGQKWSATRLATVAEYAAWVSGQTDHDGARNGTRDYIR